MNQSSNTVNTSTYYKLQWCLHPRYIHRWVDYLKLQHVNDEQGELMYRSLSSFWNFCLHTLPSASSFSMSMDSFGQFPKDSKLSFLSKQTWSNLIFSFPDSNQKECSLPLSRWKLWSAKIQFTFHGQPIIVVPSSGSGVLNSSICIEARWLHPSKTEEGNQFEGNSKDKKEEYTVLWKHQFVTHPGCGVSPFKISFLMIQEDLIHQLISSSSSSLNFNDHERNKSLESNAIHSILNLNTQEFLYCTFRILHFYFDFYTRRVALLTSFFLALFL